MLTLLKTTKGDVIVNIESITTILADNINGKYIPVVVILPGKKIKLQNEYDNPEDCIAAARLEITGGLL